MKEMLEALGAWEIPVSITAILGVIFLLMQFTGEIIEWKGKIAPDILKLRKVIKEHRVKKKKQKQQLEQLDAVVTLLTEVDKTLKEVNKHYDADNIAQRNKWMEQVNENIKWTHERSVRYDESMKQLHELQAITSKLSEFTCKQIKEDYRNRILDFQHRISNARGKSSPEYFSREEFAKIYATYADYEAFLEYTNDENHQVDNAMEVIRRAEAGELPNIVFIEDLR